MAEQNKAKGYELLDYDYFYDKILTNYVISFLYVKDYPAFNKAYIESFPQYKSTGEFYFNLMAYTIQGGLNNEQQHALLATLQNANAMAKTEMEQIGNLNAQIAVYEQFGRVGFRKKAGSASTSTV